MMPWTDRTGRFSTLKAVTFAGTLLPGLWIAWALATGAIGPKPVTAAIHETGDWAVRFLLLSLLVTPLRRIADRPRLILVRRMLGLSALGYAVVHLLLYVVDQGWDLARVASEIVLRVYLLIGFVALVGLAILGATSTDGAIRRLGRTWNRLHRATYAIAVLAILHFFLQSKIDVSEATLMAGFFVGLMGWRLMHAHGLPLDAPRLALAAVVFAVLTAAIEYAWFALATGVDPDRVLAANLQFSYSVRPAWWVLAAGLAAAVAALFSRRGQRTATGRPSARNSPA